MRLWFRAVLFSCIALIAVLTTTAVSQTKATSSDSNPPYRNPNLAIQDRVADLLSRMTLEEKVEQIAGSQERQVNIIDTTGTFTTESARQFMQRWWDPDLGMTSSSQ